MVNPKFHVALNEEEESDLSKKLGEIKNLDMFLTELHDFIMNMERPNREFDPSWK